MQLQKWRIYSCCGVILQEADRLKCATSVVHQADQACRRLISEAMKTARGRSWASSILNNFHFTVCHFQPLHNDHFVTFALENQVPAEHMRSLAARLNESKATFLHNLRGQLLQEASFTRGEDIDVERVVKRAVDVFDQEKRETLMRIMDENKWLGWICDTLYLMTYKLNLLWLVTRQFVEPNFTQSFKLKIRWYTCGHLHSLCKHGVKCWSDKILILFVSIHLIYWRLKIWAH